MTAARDIGAERVRTAFGQVPVAAAVTKLNGVLVAGLLLLDLGDWRAVPWLLILTAVLAIRLWSWYRYSISPEPEAPYWERSLVLGAAAAGLVWGGGASWLMPETDSYRLFWVFLVGGMCAGAASLHYAHLPSVLAFLLAAGLPLVLSYGLEQTRQAPRGSGDDAGLPPCPGLHRATVQPAFRRRWCSCRSTLARAHAGGSRPLDDRLRTEVAEHRTTEANLRHAQKMEAVGQLTGGIAHDFNNLLMAVLGSLALLRKRLPPADEGPSGCWRMPLPGRSAAPP